MVASVGLTLVGLVLFGIGVVAPLLVPAGPIAHRDRPILPKVQTIDVIVPAYLEATTIAGKVSDLRRDLAGFDANIVVIAPDDDTLHAGQDADILLRQTSKGKSSAVNEAIAQSSADVIVLSDANCEITPRNWPEIVLEYLEAWSLVSGNKSEVGSMETGYWKYERRVKQRASGGDGSLAVVGELMAFRRSDYKPIPAMVQCDDMWIALDFHKRKLRCTVASEVVTREPAPLPSEQWERRIRIAAGALALTLPALGDLASSRTGRRYLIHKTYRTTIGCVGFWVAVTGVALLSPPTSGVVLCFGFAAALSAYFAQRGPSLLRALGAFTVAQMAPLFGVARIATFQKNGSGAWKKVPR